MSLRFSTGGCSACRCRVLPIHLPCLGSVETGAVFRSLGSHVAEAARSSLRGDIRIQFARLKICSLVGIGPSMLKNIGLRFRF